jgi:glutathione synthase/RimK-type ligase-like ATP-grasp enzyme
MTMVFGYKRVTESGKLLARTLGAEYSYPDAGVACREGDVVINWGAGYGRPHWAERAKRWINSPQAVARSVNKLDTFRALKRAGLSKYMPVYTEDAHEAAEWINKGIVVYARTDAEGRAGKGISIYDIRKGVPSLNKVTANQLQNQGFIFYTQQFKKKWELKVHVAFGKAWLVWRIEKDRDYYDHGRYVFNYAEGFQFRRCRTDIHPSIKRVCEKVIDAVGLDFGVVDIGLGEKPGSVCVFETNTAPAIDDRDAQQYAEMFRRELKLK